MIKHELSLEHVVHRDVNGYSQSSLHINLLAEGCNLSRQDMISLLMEQIVAESHYELKVPEKENV
jgi:hypothetical protein